MTLNFPFHSQHLFVSYLCYYSQLNKKIANKLNLCHPRSTNFEELGTIKMSKSGSANNLRRTFCGLDFGTSNSTVGAFVDNTARLVSLENNKPTIRSAIFCDA